MRIAILSSYPPTVCGVGDYTALLCESLIKTGIEVQVFAKDNCRLGRIKKIWSEILTFKPDIIHIQYPNVTFGASLLPQFLVVLCRFLKIPAVVTIHEFSQAHLLRRISIIPFGLLAQKVVFTSENEFKAVRRWLPSVKNRSTIIPIGSNIPFLQMSNKRDPMTVVYFGIIRPQKGLEDFIMLAKLAFQLNSPFKFMIIGNPYDKTRKYFQGLVEETFQYNNISWQIGLDPLKVAELLNQVSYAYLPFPDGASERRGSLLATLGNGIIVITTKGKHTPKSLINVTKIVSNYKEAFDFLSYLSISSDVRRELVFKIEDYISKYSWDVIVNKHAFMYNQLLVS
jgi:Glycosyltransferase